MGKGLEEIGNHAPLKRKQLRNNMKWLIGQKGGEASCISEPAG